MTKSQCVYIVVQDPSLVVSASHEGLGLFLRAIIEPLVINSSESAIDHSISLLLYLKHTLVQFDVLHTHSLTIDYHVTRNALCHIVYYILLINQIIHLGSESHELGDAMPVRLIFDNGSRQFLVEVEEGRERREFALVHFLFVIVHKMSIEVTCVIEF